jgi:hypothetical protein
MRRIMANAFRKTADQLERRRAERAGIAAGERAERGDRPRGLQEVRVLSFLERREPPDLRFILRAFREADPDFGEKKDPDAGDDMMSREWLIRTMR